jgi:predicted Rossmann fold flavoprotein
VKVRIAGTKFEEQGPLLITHWGVSGPAILKLSAWGARQLASTNWQFTVQVNWLGAHNEQTLRAQLMELRAEWKAQKMFHRNPFGLPQRLWEYFLQKASIQPETRWADLPATAQTKLVGQLVCQLLEVKGKTTFKEEFVTAGGVKLSETDSRNMMSKKVSNLFFAGEILDVDGVTGGFNFQHAWTSGWIAAKAIAEIAGSSNQTT